MKRVKDLRTGEVYELSAILTDGVEVIWGICNDRMFLPHGTYEFVEENSVYGV